MQEDIVIKPAFRWRFKAANYGLNLLLDQTSSQKWVAVQLLAVPKDIINIKVNVLMEHACECKYIEAPFITSNKTPVNDTLI